MKKNRIIHLSATDVDAILVALGIIPYADFDTPPEQMELNCFLAQSAAQKLIAKKSDLSPNETRIIGASVILARDCLSGLADISIPSSLRNNLQPYFFNYNRLAPQYDEINHLNLKDLDYQM